MEGLFQINLSLFEEFLFVVGLIQPFILLFQLLCSSVRRDENKMNVLLNKKLKIYWTLIVFYIISVPLSFFVCNNRILPDDGIGLIYFSYWFIWLYYCIAITMEINKKKIFEFMKYGF